ncbi:hypothetical protein T265_07447 [Opisthorchis viverrini]|uniref:Uncharacterized protein n=1 Tax=Opisthorchis viverrini TaxID=6198 RepID=A0A075ABG7_OPIVI|nr:hypothetical protein T265_07447 [Opisthorchis viverrini]KER24994.1 hypothetical protein T265_07447 [Opisthorchis viverrini]
MSNTITKPSALSHTPSRRTLTKHDHLLHSSSSKELEQLTYRQIFKPQTSATLKSLADSQRTCYPEQISYLKLKSTTAVRWKLV